MYHCYQCEKNIHSNETIFKGIDKTFCSRSCRTDYIKNASEIDEYYKLYIDKTRYNNNIHLTKCSSQVDLSSLLQSQFQHLNTFNNYNLSDINLKKYLNIQDNTNISNIIDNNIDNNKKIDLSYNSSNLYLLDKNSIYNSYNDNDVFNEKIEFSNDINDINNINDVFNGKIEIRNNNNLYNIIYKTYSLVNKLILYLF